MYRHFTKHISNMAGTSALLIAFSLAIPGAIVPVIGAVPSEKPIQESFEIFSDSMEEFVLLQGEARFIQPLAFAVVTVSDGTGATITTTANEHGLFEAKFFFNNPRAILEVRARGVDGQGHEEYASYLGDMGFLIERAGEDRTLGVADLPALRLNPFQTGLYVAMRDIPTLPPAAGEDSIQRRARSFSTIDFSSRAPMIAALAAGDLTLPAGAATTLEAMSDEALAYEVKLEEQQDTRSCPDNPICKNNELVSNDADQLPLTPPLLGQTLQQYLAPGLGFGGYSLRIQLETDGTGELVMSDQETTPERAVLWTIEVDDVVRVTAADGEPLSEFVSYTWHDDCNCQIRTIYATVAIRLLFAEGPAGTVLMGNTGEMEERFPDNPEMPTVPATIYRPWAINPTVVDDHGFAGGFHDPAGTTMVLPRCGNSDCGPAPPSYYSTAPVVAEPHRFDADGSGMTLRLEDTFNWTRDAEGRLSISYASGAQGFFVAAALPTAVTGVTTGVFTASTGIPVLIADDYVAILNGTAFSEEAVPGTYLSRINSAYPYSFYQYDMQPFGYVFNPDGSGNQLGGTRPLSWAVDTQGRLSFVLENTSPNPSSSYPQRRNWELLGQDADSIYVLEFIQTPDPDSGELSETPEFGPTSRLIQYNKLD